MRYLDTHKRKTLHSLFGMFGFAASPSGESIDMNNGAGMKHRTGRQLPVSIKEFVYASAREYYYDIEGKVPIKRLNVYVS